MKLLERSIALAVSLALTLFSLPVTVFAESGESSIISGEFEYYFRTDHTETFFYSDDYFKASGKEINEHLRSMTLCLACAAFGNEDYSPGHTAELFDKLGFIDQSFEGYSVFPEEDNIATAIAHKPTPYGDVTAVAVRGSHYEFEFANNLAIGTEGDAEGLADAAQKVISRILSYREKYGLSGSKLWVTGYSRGGAVSDLTGRYINEHLDELGITDDDVYVYTFEAPRASGRECGYKNIHNIIDPKDIVPKVYPAKWALYNCGAAEKVSDGKETVINAKEFGFPGLKLKDYKKNKNDTEPLTYTTAEFQDACIQFLEGYITREEMSENSEALGFILKLVLGMGPEQKKALPKYLLAAFKEMDYSSLALNIAPLLLSDKGSKTFESSIKKLTAYVCGYLDKADHSECITDEQYEYLKGSMPGLLKLLVPVLKGEAMLAGKVGVFGFTATFVGNLDAVISPHLPVNMMETVKFNDSYYTEKPVFWDGSSEGAVHSDGSSDAEKDSCSSSLSESSEEISSLPEAVSSVGSSNSEADKSSEAAKTLTVLLISGGAVIVIVSGIIIIRKKR